MNRNNGNEREHRRKYRIGKRKKRKDILFLHEKLIYL